MSSSTGAADVCTIHVRRYPPNYSILFIPYYSSAYTGNHWAVYNEGGQFWGYDDGDMTNGDYDYDDSDGLPPGCQLSTPQEASSAGVLNLASTNGSALAPVLAPAPAPAPGSANRSASAHLPRQLLCRPVATAQAETQTWAEAHHGLIVGLASGAAGILFTALIFGLVFWEDLRKCCKRKPKPQTPAVKGAPSAVVPKK